MTDEHDEFNTPVRDSSDFDLTGTIFAISESFYPLSPFKVYMLIKNSSSGRGDSAIVSHSSYCETILSLTDNIAESCRDELDSHLRAYRMYLTRAGLISRLVVATRVLRVLMAWTLLFLFLPLFVFLKYEPRLQFEAVTSRAALPEPLTLDLLGSVLLVLIACSAVIWVLKDLAPRFHILLKQTSEPLSNHLSREFSAVLANLLRVSGERRYNSFLSTDRAPTLVEIDSASIIPSQTFDDTLDFLTLHLTSAIGIAGPRGVGKSTLLRWVTSTLRPEWTTIYLPAPGAYSPVDLVRVIFSATVNAVISSYQPEVRRSRSDIVGRLIGPWRPKPKAEEIVDISFSALSMISGSRSNQRTTASGISGKGISYQRGRQISWVEREKTHPEWVAAFTDYLETYRRLGGNRIAIAIDELDKIATADELISVINGLKDLFHRPEVHFIVSVSEDALRRFAMRGIPVRDAFDSAFDSIIKIEPPSPEDAWKILARRVGDFPMSTALFCYAWSGALVRETIRLARACVTFRRLEDRPIRIAEAVHPIVRKDIEEAIDATIVDFLDRGDRNIVEKLLELKREIPDNAVGKSSILSLERVKIILDLPSSDDSGPVLETLMMLIEVGAAVSEYFSTDIDEMLASDVRSVFEATRYLARARAALALHPTEARWLLDCMRRRQ